MLRQFEDANGKPLYDSNGKPMLYESTAEDPAVVPEEPESGTHRSMTLA